MTFAFSMILVAAALYYAGLISFFAVGFRRVRREAVSRALASATGALPFVSVVVAARNEAMSIETCLYSILANDYPADRFEVVVIDDFSEDETAAVVRRLHYETASVPAGVDAPLAETPSLTLVLMADHADAPFGHKRHALHQGIATARGDVILTTDADCMVGPRWMRTMVSFLEQDTGFVAGPVRYRPGPTLFGRLQALEFLALVATGAGGIGMGTPNMCNGANVAYRRAVYERFGSLRHDGLDGPADDEVLAQHLVTLTKWRVRFCAAPDALVETTPVLDLRRFWAQRRRWAGTGPRYPRPGLVAAILGVYLFYLLLLISLVAVFFVPGLWTAVAVAMLCKILSEAALVYPACVHFGQRRLFRYFLPEQLLQIPYVVFIGMAALLGSPPWKGRTVFA